MGKLRLSFNILSVIILALLWTPALTEHKCSLACHGSKSSASFLDGHTYNYGVDGTVAIFLGGASRQETTVKILGQVAVSALGNCVLALKVNSLQIVSPDGRKHQAPKGIDKVVKFSFEDGRIGPEVCTENDDHRASLNIKRAIISLLQTEQKPSTQIDVFGSCPTEVSSSKEGSSVLLHRTRDLSRCGYRELIKSDFIREVINPNAEVKSTQILRSVLNVETKLNNGVPEKISAAEEYLYRPFSVGENGARAEVNTKLTLSGTTQGRIGGEHCVSPKTIIFEIPHEAHADHSNAHSILSAVKETSKTLVNGATPKSAGLFAQLVRVLRSANKDDLMKVYNQVKGNSLDKRVFLDGLLRTGTGFSIEASINILKKKELQPYEQGLVYLSLGNAKHVNNEAIKAATGLLDLPNLPKEVYLGVGALAGTYCRDHNCHTDKSEGIVTLSKKFAAKLQNCKQKTKVEEDNVVAVLKGIRNMHHLEDTLIDKLFHCAADNGVKARVKVAALEAFQADPCAAKIKKTGLDILKNRQLDSEIRIKAYLSVISCPCGKSANEIKVLLENEPVHQVGRFISTSLRHIRASANPDKELARKHYGLIGIPKKFNIDDRKYSFYREGSFNLDVLGIGANAEQTVIFSQDSFLPRSVSLNLTTELFGHSVNILEIGGRQGNLDRVVEHFLGPKSFLRTEKPQQIYDNLVKKLDDSYKKVDENIRSKRSIKSDVNAIDKQIKAESAEYNNELDIDVYLKLFGTEAVFLSLGDNKGWNYDNFLDQVLHQLHGGFDKIKHFQQELRGHLLFLDAEFAYPTSTGLPLKLDFIGSATGRLDVSTAIDIRQIIRSPQNAKVDIKLVPSTDVELSFEILVDAGSLTTGLKVVSNLHSSTGGHVVAKAIENGHGFDIQWGLPIDKQEIVTASSELVFFTAEKGKLEKLTPVKVENDRKDYSACFDQLSGILGLNLCGEVSLPFQISGSKGAESISKFISKYPLVGATKVKVYLEKNDLKGYHLKGAIRSDQSHYGFDLLFEAQGNQNRRTHLAADLVNTNEEKYVKLSLESPIKNVYGEISYRNNLKELALLVKAKLDEAEYFVRAGFNVAGNERRYEMRPVLEYQIAGSEKQNLKVDGLLIAENNSPAVKYTLHDVKINLPNSNEPVNLEGQLELAPYLAELDVKARQGKHNLLLSGSLKRYDVKLEFQNTLNPFVNFKLIGHFENAEGIAHNDAELYYGADLRSPENCIVFKQLFKQHAKSAEDFNIISKNKFEIRSLPFTVGLDFEIDPKKADLEAKGVYLDKKAFVSAESRMNTQKDGDYRHKLVISLDKNTVTVFAKRDINSPDKSNFENYVDFKNVGKYELSGLVNHKYKANDINVGAVGHLKISGKGKDEDFKFDVGAVENTNLYSTHATISSTKDELLDFLIKITRGANPNGQLKLNLKNTITANGKYQITDNDGKGVGNIFVNFNKVQRIVKCDVKFLLKNPVYNAEGDIYLNFEKDNNDKIHFVTNTKRTDILFDSKNKFQYAGKTTEVNIYKDGSVELIGKLNANVEIVLPTERCLSLKVDRALEQHGDIFNGHGEVLLSDSAKRGGAASTIKIQNKLSNTNFDSWAIDFNGQAELKLNDGKNLVSTYSLKNTPKGDKLTGDYSYKNELSGSLLPKKALIDISSTYSIDGLNVGEDYRAKVSYGDDISAEIVGNYLVQLPEAGNRKLLNDVTVSVRLPIENSHDIKWASKFLYLQPVNKDVEITWVESFQVNANLYKIDANGKYNTQAGSTKLKANVPHVDPIILDVNYKFNDRAQKRTGNIDLKAQYGKGKVSTVSLQGINSPQENQLKIVSNSPHSEQLKTITIDLHGKNPTPDTYTLYAVVDANGRVYKSESLAVVSRSQPLLDWKYHSPSTQKVTRLYFKATDLRPTHTQIDTKIENFQDFNLDASLDSTFDKDILIKLQADAKSLGWKNYKIEISSQNGGNGKRLEFNAVNNNKNVLSGSTSYISKQEGSKSIIEGSGTLKVKEEKKPASFKYIRTFLTEGSEQGFESFANVAVGEFNHVVEFKATNVEFKSSYVYCEEKKECAHADINSKLLTPKVGSFQQLFNIGLDLRMLGLPTEFGLESQTEFSDNQLPQYKLNVHLNKAKDKIHLHAYSLPEFGKLPIGVTLALPHRVLALEGIVEHPVDLKWPFPIRAEINAYPDKNKPKSKTAAKFSVNVNANDNQGETTALLSFSHPKLGNEALLKLQGKYKRPNDNTIKIETSTSVSHSSLGKDREAKFNLEASPTHVKILLDTPIVQVIDLEGSAIIKDNLQQGDLKFSLLQGKPVQVYAVAKNYQYFEFTTSYSDEADRKLSVVGNLDFEKRVDISADIVLPGHKKNIIHGAVFVDNKVIKNDYGVSRENFLYFVDALKKDLINLQRRVTELGEKASNEFKAVLNRVEPKYKQLAQAYSEDFEKLVQEITNDNSLKEISEALHSFAQIIAKVLDDTLNALKPIVNNLINAVTEANKKIYELYEKQLEPQIKQLYVTFSDALKHYLDGIIDIAAHFGAIAIDFFNRYKPEIEEVTRIFTEIYIDLTRIIVAQLNEWRAQATEFLKNLFENIKDLPVFGMIKEKWQEFAVPEQLIAILKEGKDYVYQFLPTEELKNFVDALFTYAEKKAHQQKVNDVAELRVIYEKLVSAVTSVVTFMRSQIGPYGASIYSIVPSYGFGSLFGPSAFTLPTFGGSAGLSIFSQLLNGDIPDPLSLFNAYRPRSLNPLDEIPAKLRAVVVNGQHIFTFDGRHLTFPGSCNYVLAHDHVDRNFTLIINLAKGNPKSLILEDKSGVTIELKDNGQAALNGAAHSYPIIEKDVFAFRELNGRIGLGSLYGLIVFCTSKLEVCYIEVNGFYLGKLRGLLGDGNNEPYDDFRLPNGKIVNSESEFGNGYRLSNNCPATNTPQHSHHQHVQKLPEACDEVFGGFSPLGPLSFFLDNHPFRQACIHAVTGAGEKALHQACDLGRGYAALALTGLLPAVLPSTCVRCTDADTPKEVGNVYDVKLPTNQADIVVCVELTKINERNYKEIAVPLVSQLIDQLKSKRITDVKVYLIGFTSKYPYPVLYDTDLKLKTAKVQFTDESRYDLIEPIIFKNENVDNAERKLVDFINTLKVRLDVLNVEIASMALADLPLRATAVKHYISVMGEKSQPRDWLLQQLKVGFGLLWAENSAAGLSLITETNGLKIGGGKSPKQVVGFSKHSVLLLGDKKLKDTENLRTTLGVNSDSYLNLVEEADGYIYSASNFKENPGQQKQFLQTAATSIVNRLLEETLVRECACTYVDPFTVRSVCVTKERKEAARRRK